MLRGRNSPFFLQMFAVTLFISLFSLQVNGQHYQVFEVLYNSSCVTRLTEGDLERTVMNPSKCVLLYSYATWNGHSRNFASRHSESLVEISTYYCNHNYIQVAAFDGTEYSQNMTSEKYESTHRVVELFRTHTYYHTFQLFPRGKENKKPIQFEGSPTFYNFKEFIERNCNTN